MLFLMDKHWRFNFSKTVKFLAILFIAGGFTVSGFRYLTFVETKMRDFATDHLNNFYIIKGKSTLIKYNKNGRKLFHYNENKFGRLKYMDTNNPMKLLLFYPDFSTVVTLDNDLSLIGKYDLRNIGINRVSAIALASDNKLWVYDKLDYRLKKIRNDLSIQTKSESFTVLFDQHIVPEFMLERNNNVYLNDPDQGIYIFDRYGTYNRHIPIFGVKDFQIFNKQLIYSKKGEMMKYNLQTFSTDTIEIPGIDSVREAKLQKDRLYLRKKNGLDLYVWED